MGFLRRLLGGSEPDGAQAGPARTGPSAGEPDEDERRYEFELMAAEAARLDDFLRRQERYADRSWVPPAQGTGRRAGEDATEDLGAD